MPAVYVARISQWIEKRFNAKGGNVITDVDTTGVVQLTFPSGVEDRYLQGWNRYIYSAGVAAVAAQFSRFLLRNPPGSNAIAVIESLFFNTANSDYSIENAQGNLTTVQGAFLQRLDQRSLFGAPVLIASQDNNASQTFGAATVIMRRQIGEVIFNADQEITLLPNDGLFCFSDVVNTLLQLNLTWRERALEQSELT